MHLHCPIQSQSGLNKAQGPPGEVCVRFCFGRGGPELCRGGPDAGPDLRGKSGLDRWQCPLLVPEEEQGHRRPPSTRLLPTRSCATCCRRPSRGGQGGRIGRNNASTPHHIHRAQADGNAFSWAFALLMFWGCFVLNPFEYVVTQITLLFFFFDFFLA